MTIQITPKHHFIYDGAVVNVYHANKGEGLPAHSHQYSHATICCSGSCVVRKENKEMIIKLGTQPLNLIGNEWHEIEALEDNTVFVNVFAEGKY